MGGPGAAFATYDDEYNEDIFFFNPVRTESLLQSRASELEPELGAEAPEQVVIGRSRSSI